MVLFEHCACNELNANFKHMKTILVDAWNTFITENGVDTEIKKMLDDFPEPKIIVTNANSEEQQSFGMVNLPYPLFTMSHNPNKPNPEYFKALFKKFALNAESVIYFEHHPDAVKTAESLGITTYHFNHEERDIALLKAFITAAL